MSRKKRSSQRAQAALRVGAAVRRVGLALGGLLLLLLFVLAAGGDQGLLLLLAVGAPVVLAWGWYFRTSLARWQGRRGLPSSRAPSGWRSARRRERR